MLRTVLWTLRQRRYAAMAVLFFIIAAGCVAAGTWQIARFQESVRANNALRANAHAPSVPLTTSVVPLVGHGPAPSEEAIRFRTVTVTGHYAAAGQQYLLAQSSRGSRGYDVVTPFRTASGTVLVERGFVGAGSGGRPPSIAPPTGQVRITGRLQAVAAPLTPTRQGSAVITAIDPAAETARLGGPVFQTYLTLDAHQPGAAGVSVLPPPDLSNPAGGAYEWQHFAYIIQWYLFALLALVAPFAIARHEVREARRRFLGEEARELDFDEDELPAGTASGELAVRDAGTVARPGDLTPAQLQRAVRLADRYGRALSMGPGPETAPAPARARRRPDAPFRRGRGLGQPQRASSSAEAPHRSDDLYHGAYNDYLWQLALADGAISAEPEAAEDERPAPRVIDADDEDASTG